MQLIVMLSLLFYIADMTLSIMIFSIIKSKTLRIMQLVVMLILLFHNVTMTMSIMTFSIIKGKTHIT
jgi:hypothetical protein